MITDKIKDIEKVHGELPTGSFHLQVHVQWAKRGLPRDNYHFNTTRGTAIKSGNLWIIKSRDPNKFDVEVDLVKKTIDIRVKLKEGDHREWLLPLVDSNTSRRWVVLHDATQLFIEWEINCEMGEAFNIMQGSFIAARV